MKFLLNIQNLCTGYGYFKVLNDLSLQIPEGYITAIIGPNGSGKSTILKSIIGLVPAWQGQISLFDKKIDQMSVPDRIKSGITYSPQGNIVFDEMTIKENLEIAGFLLQKTELQDRIEEILQIFPLLKERYNKNAGFLSGGEQQILALARALIPRPALLLLDEPSLGLSPNILFNAFQKFGEINEKYKTTILIVEQKVNDVLVISDHVFGIKLGKIAYNGPAKELINQKETLQEIFL